MQRIVVSCICVLLACAAPVRAQTLPIALDTLHVSVGSRVSAALPVATRAVEVITAEEVARQPVRTVQEALGWALGVDLNARSPAQADMAIRGGSFEQVLVLVDGTRVSDAQTGHFDLDLTVPLDEVDRIEILRGPASAVYGADAFSGVVNIVTRRADEATIHGRLDGGSFGTGGAAFSAHTGGDRVRFGGTAEYRRSDGHRAGTDYEIAAGHVALEAEFDDRLLRATFGVAHRDFGAAQFYTPPSAGFDEFESTRVVNLMVAWEAPRDARFAIEPRLILREHDDEFLLERGDPELFRNVHRSGRMGAEVTARYTADRVRLAVGGEAFHDMLESNNLGERVESRAAVFAEAGVGGLGASLLSGGVRADWHSEYGTFVAPSLAGAVWLSPRVHLRAAVSRAFRAPTWTERYYRDPSNVGDPGLRPERGWEAELGTEVTTGAARLSLTGYVRRSASLIDWARPGGSESTAPWQTMNVEEATFRGVELAVSEVDFLGARWGAQASAITFDGSEASDFESKSALRPVTRQVAVDVDRSVVADVGVWLRATYARRAEEDGYIRLDARLRKRIGAGQVFVDLTNLTDADYLDVSRMQSPGRAVHVGLDWSWPR